MYKKIAYVLAITLILAAVYAGQRIDAPFVPPATPINADTVELEGYAWSGDIGYISFNCKTGGATGNNVCATTNYSVVVQSNTAGTPMPVVGYAWNEKVGWIRFGGVGTGSGELGNPPVATSSPNPQIIGNNLVGWARACTVFASGCSGALKSDTYRGGWDGWISLSNSNHNGSPAYGGSVGIQVLSGYVWGADVVGWIGLSGITYSAPCGAGTTSCQPGTTSPGYDSTNQWCQVTSVTCASGRECVASPTATCAASTPAGTFTASAQRVRSGQSVTLSYSVSNVGACTITPDNTALTAMPLTVDSVTATSIGSTDVAFSNETTLTLSCTDVDGLNPTTIGTVKIGIIPSLEQI